MDVISVLITFHNICRTENIANMMLLAKAWLTIPPHKETVTGDMSCKMSLPSDAPIHPFAFRTHAHSLGSVITGYRYHSCE